MTYLYLVGGALFVGLAVLAVVASFSGTRSSALERVRAVIDTGALARGAPGEPDVSIYLARDRQGLLAGIATRLGGLFSGRLTTISEKAIGEQLMAAGMYTVSPRTIIGYRILTTVVLPVLAVLVVGVHSLLDVAIVALAVFMGWVLPLTYVQRKARLRIETIDRALPDLIDLLTVMIEAGLSFPQAMRMSAGQFDPPLGDELRLTLQEQTMGLSIDEALGHMADRADTPAMRSFVRAMSQGERMGISLGQIMRNLAHEMRARRRSRAEERAQKTPVLMLFPLVFLIFPAIFIVLMTPAVISLVHNLGHLG
ncbi:MAG: type II secretion system F family protein [Actinomycetota bacterium]|nr:type II secretion system F family protein [Actinomycetota bacterium]